MFAVIKTGGKQYRVSPGDMLIVEKLPGAPGDELSFDQVLMLGEGERIAVGAPLVDGGRVKAVLVETRKGDKIKVFKKKRRQGYRRTKGHRQTESVLRVTGLEGAGLAGAWNGEVDLTPRAVLLARSRGLTPPEMPTPGPVAVRSAPAANAAEPEAPPEGVDVAAVVADAASGPLHHPAIVEHADPVGEPDPAPTKVRVGPAAPETAVGTSAPDAEGGALIEPPTSEIPADAPQTVEAPAPGEQAGAGADNDSAIDSSAPERSEQG